MYEKESNCKTNVMTQNQSKWLQLGNFLLNCINKGGVYM